MPPFKKKKKIEREKERKKESDGTTKIWQNSTLRIQSPNTSKY
jgi:hypothetical protein